MIKIIFERSREISLDITQSAKEGLKTLQSKTFDALIVDYAMPAISGINFLKTLRSKGDRTPIIIFTAVDCDNVAIDALNYGANFFLHKRDDPRLQFHELVTVVPQAVEQNPAGRLLNATQRTISDVVNFSPDPSFAIDPDGQIIACNDLMEQLTSIPTSTIIGKGDFAYAEPFFGTRRKMLVNRFLLRTKKFGKLNIC